MRIAVAAWRGENGDWVNVTSVEDGMSDEEMPYAQIAGRKSMAVKFTQNGHDGERLIFQCCQRRPSKAA